LLLPPSALKVEMELTERPVARAAWQAVGLERQNIAAALAGPLLT